MRSQRHGRPDRFPRWVTLLVGGVVLGASALGACGTSSPTGAAPATGASSTSGAPSTAVTTTLPIAPSTSTAATAVVSPTTSTSGVMSVDETTKGKTVSLHVGDTLRVVLHSTYWHIDDPADATVVRATGAATVAAVLAGNGCVVGQGCGTVTQDFTAAAAGRSTLTAARTSCGEAMACAPDAASWSVTVVVG